MATGLERRHRGVYLAFVVLGLTSGLAVAEHENATATTATPETSTVMVEEVNITVITNSANNTDEVLGTLESMLDTILNETRIAATVVKEEFQRLFCRVGSLCTNSNSTNITTEIPTDSNTTTASVDGTTVLPESTTGGVTTPVSSSTDKSATTKATSDETTSRKPEETTGTEAELQQGNTTAEPVTAINVSSVTRKIEVSTDVPKDVTELVAGPTVKASALLTLAPKVKNVKENEGDD